MKFFRNRLVSLRDLLATAWPILLITAIGLYIAYQFVEPAPPRRMTMTTGSTTGAYYAYAQRYAEFLAIKGIQLEVRTSAGSVDNIQRLTRGEADVAFVQGGVNAPTTQAVELHALGSVAYEPVWVFYRSAKRADKLTSLAGSRIAVGEEGSGIRGLALKLLEVNNISAKTATLVPIAGLSAVEAMQQGRIDAAFIVAAPEAQVVQKMLRVPGVRVMGFSQADAYTRRFPFLSKIVFPHGVVDLVHDIPPRDTPMLATTANVVVRADLHPALVSLLLQAMTEVNGQSGLFHQAGDFPAYRDRSFELAPDAERYYKSGPPFLQRYLPFWVAVLVERLFVLIVPLIVLLFPLLKLAPSIYNWRIRSRVFRIYGELKQLEGRIRSDGAPAKRAEYLAQLDRIEEDAFNRNIPLSFSDLHYTLREHIHLVRTQLLQLEHAKPDEPTP